MIVTNQRGGIISTMFIIPAGVVVLILVFALGYYVGKNQAARTALEDKLPELPEVVSQHLPDKEEFTFYKTLTEKENKTLSIELKPKPQSVPSEPNAPASGAKQPDAGKSAAPKQEKAVQKPHTAKVPQAQPAREVPKAKTAPSKLRYTIQVGSYPGRDLADENVRAMKKRGYAAFLVATVIPAKGTWYRVRVGSFSSKQSAEKLAAELKAKEGLATFITVE